MLDKQNSENEDQPKVKGPRRWPPGSQTRLAAATGEAVVEPAAAWTAAVVTPRQRRQWASCSWTRHIRRWRAMPLEDKVKILEKLEEGVSNINVGRIFFFFWRE